MRSARNVATSPSSPSIAGVQSANPITKHSPKNPYERPEESPPKRQPAVIARQIMSTHIVTVPPEMPFDEVWKLIRERRFRHVPVVDGDQKVVGIISDRDVLREAAQVHTQLGGSWVSDVVAHERTAGEFMTRKVLVATPTTEIRQIARAMFEERIGSMPIIDEGHHLLGLITRSDILRTLVNKAPLELWL